MMVAALGFLCFLGLSAYVAYVDEGTQMQWSKNDPREHTTKGRIIVVTHNGMVMWGEVETKHGYCVFLYPQDKDFRRLVAEDESWPGWFWINAPHR
jgi:hypothetical protein